jgi:hypothetical protein
MPLPKNLSAKCAVGDKVRLQAGVTWTIVGRFWRARTREVVYDLKASNLDYVTRQPEHRLFPASVGEG